MTWWLKNMWKKHNTNGFSQNKQNINKKWPPKKWISLFIQQCKNSNINPASKKDIEATYMSLVNMSIEELQKVSEDKKQPIVVNKLAEFMINSKDEKIFETMLDRWIGKAMQREEIKHTWVINLWEIQKMSDEELEKLANSE